MNDKVEHVRAVGRKPNPTRHLCHWPGCNQIVPPAMWGCRRHWFKLPKPMRDKIWRTYRPGQEDDKRPSAEYIEAAREVQYWIIMQNTMGR